MTSLGSINFLGRMAHRTQETSLLTRLPTGLLQGALINSQLEKMYKAKCVV